MQGKSLKTIIVSIIAGCILGVILALCTIPNITHGLPVFTVNLETINPIGASVILNSDIYDCWKLFKDTSIRKENFWTATVDYQSAIHKEAAARVLDTGFFTVSKGKVDGEIILAFKKYE